MKTNSIGKSFMIEKILKIDISWNASKSISWTFLGNLRNETIMIYVFHQILWKKYFTVYPRLKSINSWYSSRVKSMIFYWVILRKKQWVAKHATEQLFNEYTNMVKSCNALNCQNRKKRLSDTILSYSKK